MLSPNETQELLAKLYPREALAASRVMYVADETIEIIGEMPVIEAHFPEVRFYRTRMTTNYESYYKVDIAVAQRGRESPVVLWSPLFRNESPEFTAVFTGSSIAKNDRNAFGRELAGVYASLYPGGTLRQAATEEEFGFELLRNEQQFRRLTIRFSAEGLVSGIECLPARN